VTLQASDALIVADETQGTSNGTLDFNLISVFPPTYKGRKNGLRIDIAEALEELNPVRVYLQKLTLDMHS
jgi:alpha-N-arabinofuranosidase